MTKVDVIAHVRKTLETEGNAILHCAQDLDRQASQIKKVVELLLETLNDGNKIIVTGIGKSGKVGQKIAATLASTGSLAVFLHPTEGLHGDLGIASPGDSVIALSYTGNTDELVELLPTLRSRKIKVIGICGNPQSQLVKLSDAWIDASVQEEACPNKLAPTTSTTLALAIGDALAVTLMVARDIDIQDFASNHPGGTLGRRLTLRVGDVMRQGTDVPIVSEEDSLEKVVVVCTEKKMGAVLVTEGSQLRGIITDGDIRRALQKGPEFFQLQAKDIMSPDPVTCRSDLLVSEALGVLQKNGQSILVLAVADDKKNWQGLVQIHDLVNKV